MGRVSNSRRAVIALVGIFCITAIGLVLKIDVSMAISSIVMAVAGSNAIEKFSNKEPK